FCREQAAALRQPPATAQGAPAPLGRPLLANIAPGDDEIDWFDLAAEVDIIAWDNYPHGFPDWAGVALFHDHVRGLKQAPFWVMEQQPGPINWTATNPPVPPGQVRLWTYQDAAHGAENVLFFRWRAGRVGQEQFHSGLLSHAAQPTRGHAEARQVAEEWATWGQPRAAARKAALLISYDDLWAQQIDPHAAGWSYWRLARIIHRSLLEHGIGVDVLRRGSDLAGYSLAVAVAPTIIDEAEAAHWREWTAAGGTLVATARAFTKDRDNRWTDQPLPAGLTDFFGAEVAEWTALVPNVPGHLSFADSGDLEIELWAEILRPTVGNPLLTYTAGYAIDQTAATAATYGKGMAVLLGFHPSDEVLAELWPRLLPEASRLPLGVEQIALDDGLLLFNHTRYPAEVTLSGAWIDRLTGQTLQGQCSIPELDVRWLQRADA
ncbi:MAG TPA: beta-galactosidase trimerization domain-containing protein, partial [Herpetosiphonaceae bacterium]